MSSLMDTNEVDYLIKVYLLPLRPEGNTTEEEMSQMLGLREYPLNSSASVEQLGVYRFLGTNKEDLDCNSTVLIATRLRTTPADQIKCNGEQVVFLKIPFADSVPYMDITYGNSLIHDFNVDYGSKRHLTISNYSGVDLWFEWFRDVHGNHQLDFIPHARHKTRKSRRVAVSAYFPVKVYKNNAGEKGEYLDEFTAQVFGHDRVECIVVSISGQQYLQVVSVVELPGKILLSVLLGE